MATIKYVLSDSAVVFSNHVDEIRIRKGVWNYEEAVISLAAERKSIRELMLGIFRDFEAGKIVDFEAHIKNYTLLAPERENLENLVIGLREQGYIVDAEKSDTSQLLYDLINGSFESRGLPNETYLQPILFFSDTATVREEAVRLCEAISLPVHVMTEEEYMTILQADVVTRFDGCTTKENLSKICDIIAPYCCLVGGLGKVHVSFLRNLNRAMIELSKPLSLALLDGPFTSVFTIKPPETGCFECMEQRIFARMQEHSVYRKFVEATRDKFVDREHTYYTPLLSSVVSTAIFEGLTISAVGKSKFAGRVLNTYVPVMEMQVEDVLRVPYCPACGTIAKAQIDEMYTSSKKVVDAVLENIELV